ncbi:MAG: OmpA family protein [Pseudomonadota bacterium]
MRAILIVVIIAAAGFAGWSALTELAPRMQADIDARADAAVQGIAKHDVRVETDGRHITLTGIADSPAERERLIAAVDRVNGQVAIADHLRVLEVVRPYTLRAWQSPTGRIAITGVVPSRAAERSIRERAESLAGNSGIEISVSLASGVADDQWVGMVEAGLAAMMVLEDGAIRLSDRNAVLSGLSQGVSARDAAIAALSLDSFGNWQTEINIKLPVAQPYRFVAEKGEGIFRWEGHAPDQNIEARLAERAGVLGGKGAEGSIELATGMPSPGWPALVENGLGSLSLMKEGRLEVEDQRVALSGTVSSFEDLTRLEATFDPSWLIEVTVLSPDPAPSLILDLPLNGQAEAKGRLPRNFDLSLLPTVLPEIDTEAVLSDAAGDAQNWESLIDALAIISPRLREARVAVSEGRLNLQGTVKREFQAQDTRAALNAALPEGWKAELAIEEAPPLPALTLSRSAGLALTGVLPTGIDPLDALALTGADQGSDGLTASGDGDPAPWRRALGAIGRLAVAYQSGEIQLSPEEMTSDGALAPGYLRKDVQVWMDRLLPDGWKADVKGTELAAVEGDRRINLISVESERYRGGFWLPELQFDATPDTCDSQARAALSAEKITFVTGSTRIDAKARSLINRLASVALRCANEARLRLEIAGHTDNVGTEIQNQSLSERRAKAVLEALAARGVVADAMTAKGFGEVNPLTSNDTEEGRAQNRRIDFHFTE